MRNYLLVSILMSLLLNANANINTIYQANNQLTNNAMNKTQSLTNDSISLNPATDEINMTDPRIQSIIEYAHANSYGVSIIFFNKENLRYVKKLNELFTTNNIFTDPPELAKTKNLVDFNLIKIYVIKEKCNVNNAKPTK